MDRSAGGTSWVGSSGSGNRTHGRGCRRNADGRREGGREMVTREGWPPSGGPPLVSSREHAPNCSTPCRGLLSSLNFLTSTSDREVCVVKKLLSIGGSPRCPAS